MALDRPIKHLMRRESGVPRRPAGAPTPPPATTHGEVARLHYGETTVPEVGTVHMVLPRVESESAGYRCDQRVLARVREIGDHWSDQPTGRSGYWVIYDLLEPATSAGRPVPAEEVC